MNTLTFGIPSKEFSQETHLKDSQIFLFCAESRPYEKELSAWCTANDSVDITILTDNMIASLCSEKAIDRCYFFGTINEENVTTIEGTSAVLEIVKQFSIPTTLINTKLPIIHQKSEFFEKPIDVANTQKQIVITEELSTTEFDEVL